MRHYRITEVATGVVTEYDADVPLPEHLTDAYSVEEVGEATAAPDTPPEVYGGSWHVTKLAFRSRFTQVEKVAIEIASLDVPTAPMPQRSLAAALRANQADVATAQYIDLKRADTRAGVQALETYGLITVGRAAEILDAPPTDVELWNGN